MNKDYYSKKQPTDLGRVIAELRGGLITSQQKNSEFNEKSYKELLLKYEEALGVIESLKSKIDELESNKLPKKEEVESMSAMLDLFSKLDPETLGKLEKFGKK